MREFLLRQLKLTIASFARRTVAKFKPIVVGVTGSVGKTSAKEAIFTVLSTFKNVRRNHANLNNELGFPLSILGDYKSGGGAWFWLRVVLRSMAILALPRPFVKYFGGYPEVLVLEYAADKPGDIKYLLEIAKPNIAVVTALGDTPVHVEFYDSPEAVLREKARLIEALPATGLAILSGDEPRVAKLGEKTRASVLTYGFGSNCDLRLMDFENKLEMLDKVLKPIGITFKLGYGGVFVPIRLGGTLGKTQALAAAAAASVGLAFNLNLVQVGDALAYYHAPAQRMRFLAGIKHATILDDSYNASPLAMTLALETVGAVKAYRKVGILGDMRELGKFSTKAHQEIGELAAKVFDVIIAVGPAAATYAQMAVNKRMAKKNILHVQKVEEALPQLRDLIHEGDLVLVKGSHSIGLEKAVAALQQL